MRKNVPKKIIVPVNPVKGDRYILRDGRCVYVHRFERVGFGYTITVSQINPEYKGLNFANAVAHVRTEQKIAYRKFLKLIVSEA